MSGGWVAAAGILAGLYARAATGAGPAGGRPACSAQACCSTAACSSATATWCAGPALDGDQTGYGPGYRLYRGCRRTPGSPWSSPTRRRGLGCARCPSWLTCPAAYAPLRGGDARQRRPARPSRSSSEHCVTGGRQGVGRRLRDEGVLAEVVEDVDRDALPPRHPRRPGQPQLGRAVAYETADWGHFEQIGPLLRCGPDVDGGPSLNLPGVGEHSVEVLDDLGIAPATVDALLDAGIIRQAEPT